MKSKKKNRGTYTHFELYRTLKNRGVEVWPEIQIDNCRCDLLVYEGHKPIIAIEAKGMWHEPNIFCRQYQKYQNLWEKHKIYPIYYNGFINIDGVCEKVIELIDVFRKYHTNPDLTSAPKSV